MFNLALKDTLLLFLSGFCYAAALGAPYCSGLILVFMVPLYILGVSDRLGFWAGLLWGYVFFFFHVWQLWLWVGSEYDYGILIVLVFLTYLALLPGLWFWVLYKILCKIKSLALKVLSISIGLLLFIELHGYIYFWFDPSITYWLSDPCIALAPSVIGQCLLMLPRLFCLLAICTSNIAVYFLCKHRYGWLPILLIMVGLGTRKKIDSISSTRSNILSLNSPYDQIAQLAECSKVAQSKNIFFPESAFPYPIDEYPETAAWFDKDSAVYLGAHRWEHGVLKNTVCLIKDGKLAQYYDKRILMPFIEYIPNCCSCSLLRRYFFSNKCEFTYGCKKHVININSQNYELNICADFFLSNPIGCKAKRCVFVNDKTKWGPISLYFHGAQYAAFKGESIVYIGYQGK